MLERLLEFWLDSSNELGYQPVFCQMLAAQGHRVLHSTRHAPIEFGKDIISQNPKGEYCAYQLKGNPAGRLTLAQYRVIQPQLLQLIYQPIVFPGVRVGAHRSYLVTNGEVEEEVLRSIDDLNRGLPRGKRKLEVINRGTLLQWSNEFGARLWPAAPKDLQSLLALLLRKGREPFPTALLHRLLKRQLSLSPKAPRLRQSQAAALASAAAILTAVSLRGFTAKRNHLAIITAWTMYHSYVVALIEKNDFALSARLLAPLNLSVVAIKDALSDLCSEIRKRKHLFEGNMLADVPFHPPRRLLLSALMSVYWFWGQHSAIPEANRTFVETFVKTVGPTPLWGEACIPQQLARIWLLREVDATNRPDAELAALLKLTLDTALRADSVLPSPYYKIERVMAHRLKDFLRIADPFDGDSANGRSWFALGLLHLLARTGLKRTCKELWPSFSKVSAVEFKTRSRWEHCLARASRGTEMVRLMPSANKWTDLVEAARDVNLRVLPTLFAQDRCILLLFSILFPYRCTPSVVRHLGWRFNASWFISPPKSARSATGKQRSSQR